VQTLKSCLEAKGGEQEEYEGIKENSMRLNSALARKNSITQRVGGKEGRESALFKCADGFFVERPLCAAVHGEVLNVATRISHQPIGRLTRRNGFS
jgi:hypothetical protein